MRKVMLASVLVAAGLVAVGCDSATTASKAGTSGASGPAAGAKIGSEKAKEAADKTTAPTSK